MRGQIVPVEITIYDDRSFTFILKTPPTPALIRQAAGLDKGSVTPGKGAGTITQAQLAEIAQTKMPDLNALDIEAAKLQVAGTARSWASKSSEPSSASYSQQYSQTGRGAPRPGSIVHHRGRSQGDRIMAKHGKKYIDATKRFDREQFHTVPPRPLALLRRLATAKFDETIELAIRLGVDPRKADQIVRGTVGLPAGTGKDVRVAVFAAGDAAAAARPPAPTSSAPKTSSRRSVAASSTSTSPSPPRTSWVRSESSVACSVLVASCPTPRPAPSPPTSPLPLRPSRVAASNTAPTVSATFTCPSARPRSPRTTFFATPAPCSTRFSEASPLQPRASTSARSPCLHHGPRRRGSTPTNLRSPTRKSRGLA